MSIAEDPYEKKTKRKKLTPGNFFQFSNLVPSWMELNHLTAEKRGNLADWRDESVSEL